MLRDVMARKGICNVAFTDYFRDHGLRNLLLDAISVEVSRMFRWTQQVGIYRNTLVSVIWNFGSSWTWTIRIRSDEVSIPAWAISKTYADLHDKSTGLYLYGDLYVADKFIPEMENKQWIPTKNADKLRNLEIIFNFRKLSALLNVLD